MTELLELVHNRMLLARKVERIVTSEPFAKVVKTLKPEEKEKVKNEIISLNAEALLERLRKSNERELGELTLRELRTIARRLRVPNYCRTPKWQLIREIQQIEKDNQDVIQGSLSLTTLLGMER